MRVAILVLAIDTPVYNTLINQGIRKTWGSVKHKNTDIYYYYGGMERTEMDGDIIRVNYPEGLFNIGYKTIETFKMLYDLNKYDYIFRTNASSYVNQEELYQLLLKSPKTNLYSGLIGYHLGNKSAAFVSGSGYILSMDLVKYVIDNASKWNHHQWDDVALSELLSHVPKVPAPRQDYTSLDSIHDMEKLFKRVHHYRCKFDDDRSMDLLTMYKLHEITLSIKKR